jgi:hypothetical protein
MKSKEIKPQLINFEAHNYQAEDTLNKPAILDTEREEKFIAASKAINRAFNQQYGNNVQEVKITSIANQLTLQKYALVINTKGIIFTEVKETEQKEYKFSKQERKFLINGKKESDEKFIEKFLEKINLVIKDLEKNKAKVQIKKGV